MIYSDSRYANGNIFRAYKPSTNAYEAMVTRNFPTEEAEYFVHTFKHDDRIDLIAFQYYNNGSLWWRIMDYNPEISNPFVIVPGTKIRIPRGG
jgi:nucleoid-associated protein YgaU